jgi:glutathione S-transferase
MAIAAWLAARDPMRRISFDARSAQSDRMYQFIGFFNTGFTGAFSPLWTALEMNPPDPTFQAALRRQGEHDVRERHDRLETMLGQSPFLLGDQPSLADGVLIGVARWLDFHQVEQPGRWPRLAALRARIEVDPAVQFALATERAEQPPGSGAWRGHVPLSEVIARFGN